LTTPSAEPFAESLIEVDGRAVRVLEAGAGPAVLLLHGAAPGQSPWCGSADLWGPFAGLLVAAGCRVIAIDRPGAGGSAARAVDDLTYGAVAGAVAGVAAARGLGPVHLVGHGPGGLVALLLARAGQHDLAVRSATVLNSPEVTPTGDMAMDVALLHPPAPGGTAASQLWAMGRLSFDNHHLDGLGPLLSRLAAAPANAAAAAIAADQAADARLRGDLLSAKGQVFAHARDHGYDVPIQLIWGANDPSSPPPFAVATLNYLATTTAELSLSFVNRAGHFAFREKPGEVAGLVSGFVARFAAGRDAPAPVTRVPAGEPA